METRLEEEETEVAALMGEALASSDELLDESVDLRRAYG